MDASGVESFGVDKGEVDSKGMEGRRIRHTQTDWMTLLEERFTEVVIRKMCVLNVPSRSRCI